MLNPLLPDNYEHVKHPKHYNNHPSKIECIDVIEHLSFNLGTAFKYVMRRDGKNSAKQDLQKALVYLERKRTIEPVKEHFILVFNYITKIIEYETVEEAKKFYAAVLSYIVAATDNDHDKPTNLQLNMRYLFIKYAVVDLIKKYP